jgi:hypothetical protein
VAAFKVGDRVAWAPTYAAQFAPGAVLTEEAVLAYAPDAELGKVKKVANDEGTYFDVVFGKETRTLTEDELVKVDG